MSLDSPTYLNSLQNNIRARPIPWEGAVRAGNITEEQLRRVKAVDKVRKEQRQKTIEKDLGAYSTLLTGGSSGKGILESAARRTDIIQYVLVLAGDLINGMIDGATFYAAGYIIAKHSISLSRRSCSQECLGSRPGKLSTLLTSTPTFDQPRRSDPTADCLFIDQPDFRLLTIFSENNSER